MNTFNPFTLEGKTILVTGASSGIGKAIAIACSKMGAKLIITARHKERLQDTFNQLEGKEHELILADLAKSEDIDKIVMSVSLLDGLVNCAGFTIPKPFTFISKENMVDVMRVNFEAPVFLTQQFVKRKSFAKQASVVFISSISGVYVSYMAGSLYSASKGAVNGMVKGMALELASKNIRVNSVNPAMINTEILSSGVIDELQLTEDMKKYPLGRYGEPEEVAYAVIYLLSDASVWVTGSNLLIDGGYTLL
ncbi:MAG TPA: SDR family oxidoreductase [Bacteroidales bacterium]|nr:SDR family oxidoreductase [Bacteroidales bacterium]